MLYTIHKFKTTAIIAQGITELGVNEDEHIMLVIEALSGIAKELGFNGAQR